MDVLFHLYKNLVTGNSSTFKAIHHGLGKQPRTPYIIADKGKCLHLNPAMVVILLLL